VEGTRTRGFASVDGRFIPGLNAISAPVLNWQGEVEAAVTLVSGDRAILKVDSPPLAMLRELCASVSVPGHGGTGGRAGQEDVKAPG
jgi:DNA-binding IclR family transcriptional regulator